MARGASLKRAALALAVRNAATLMSVPNPQASGSSDNSANKIAPEPVPISAMRNRRPRSGAARSICNASSTTVSVSGLGTSVAAESFSGSPQNSLIPRMRAIGSPESRRRAKSSRRIDSSDVSGRLAAAITPVRSRSSAAPTSIRASSSAESIRPDLNRAVSMRRAASTVCPAKITRRPRDRRGAPTASMSSLRKQDPIRRDLSIRAAQVDAFRNNERLWLRVPAFAGTTIGCRSRRGALGGELRRLMLGRQCIDQFAKGFARHHLRKLVEGEVDAMIGDAALRKIIGADALRPIPRPDLLATIRRARRLQTLAFGVVDTGAQDGHRHRAVLMLGTAVLHADDDAARDVGDADRGFGLVDVLAAGALRTHRLDP